MNRQITLQHIKKYLHNNKTKKKPMIKTMQDVKEAEDKNDISDLSYIIQMH